MFTVAQPTHLTVVKISGDSVENSQYTFEILESLSPNNLAFGASFILKIDEFTWLFKFASFLKVDLIRELQKALHSVDDNPPSADFEDLRDIEALFNYCQGKHLLYKVIDKLRLAIGKGFLVPATSGQLQKQTKKYSDALLADPQIIVKQPKISNHRFEIRPQSAVRKTIAFIADFPVSIFNQDNKGILGYEIGAIEDRVNQIFNINLEFDIDQMEANRATSTARHIIQNPQHNHSVGIAMVDIITSAVHTIPLQHFYVEGKIRALLPDETDFRQKASNNKPAKEQRHSYLITLIDTSVSFVPEEHLMTAIFAGASILDVSYYSQLVEAYIFRITRLKVTVLARTASVPVACPPQVLKSVVYHHYNAIYLVAFAASVEDMITIQIALGLGLPSDKNKLSDQPKIHFVDDEEVVAMIVSKNYLSLENVKYDDLLFRRTGFEVSDISMCYFPYIEQALSQSTSYKQFKTLAGAVHIFGTPAFAVKSFGRMRADVLNLRILCKHTTTVVTSHALDSEFLMLAPVNQRPIYSVLSHACFTNIPTLLTPMHQLFTAAHNYHTVSVERFNNGDVLKAKRTYPQDAAAVQRVFSAPIGKAMKTPLTPHAEKFLAEQRAKMNVADEGDSDIPLNPSTDSGINAPHHLNSNLFASLGQSDDEDEENPNPLVTGALNSSTAANANAFPSLNASTKHTTGRPKQHTAKGVASDFSVITRASAKQTSSQQSLTAAAAQKDVLVSPTSHAELTSPATHSSYLMTQQSQDNEHQIDETSAQHHSQSSDEEPSYTQKHNTDGLTFNEQSEAAREQVDAAATAAASALNTTPHNQEHVPDANPHDHDRANAMVEGIHREEDIIDDEILATAQYMIDSTKKGRITVGEHAIYCVRHRHLIEHILRYINAVIVLPASSDTSDQREGATIRRRQHQIDQALLKPYLDDDDILLIVYWDKQIKWRLDCLEQSRSGVYRDFLPPGEFQQEGQCDLREELDYINQESAARTSRPLRALPPPPPIAVQLSLRTTVINARANYHATLAAGGNVTTAAIACDRAEKELRTFQDAYASTPEGIEAATLTRSAAKVLGPPTKKSAKLSKSSPASLTYFSVFAPQSHTHDPQAMMDTDADTLARAKRGGEEAQLDPK